MSAAHCLVLDGELTIYRAAELHQMLLGALATLTPVSAALTIDLAGVTELDSAGVQLLLAVKRAADAGGHALTLADPSQPVREVMRLFDLTGHLGMASHQPVPAPVQGAIA